MLKHNGPYLGYSRLSVVANVFWLIGKQEEKVECVSIHEALGCNSEDPSTLCTAMRNRPASALTELAETDGIK